MSDEGQKNLQTNRINSINNDAYDMLGAGALRELFIGRSGG